MALTVLQRTICRAIAQARIAAGESYIAGGAALNELTGAARVSHDIALFHDTEAAVEASWEQDRTLLEQRGFTVRVLRHRPAFVEAEVAAAGDSVRMEWARDSAFRFFPLVTHPELGLTLHPVDLATNKVLALVGRLEVRDWVDVLTCVDRIQPLGFLAWAASGKDPGFGPSAILTHASRTARYSADEVATLAYAGDPPDPGELSRAWHHALDEAYLVVDRLPPEEAGTCVLMDTGELCRAGATHLDTLVARGRLRFHAGRIRGALP